MKVLWHTTTTVLIMGLIGWWCVRFMATDSSQPYPNRPIEIVVPYPAGGGSDTFVRTLQKGFVEDNLLPQPLVVINVAGGGGTIGSREVKDADPDGYRILCHHDALITARLSKTVTYGPEAFTPIALTGALTMVVIVREDSPFRNLRDLLDAARATPREITFGANQGAPAYFAALQLARCVPGSDFSIVSADGGADRYARILGGHLHAAIFSLSEYLDFRSPDGTPPDQNIRAIGVLGKQRHPAIPAVPTAMEQDLPVLLKNANYWWAPKGTPPNVVAVLVRALQQAMQNETVKSELTRLRVDLDFEHGDEFRATIEDKTSAFQGAVQVQKRRLPDFTYYVGWTVVALFAWMLADLLLNRSGQITENSGIPIDLNSDEDFPRRPWTAAACFVILLLYVFVLQQHWLPFAPATIAMVFVVGSLMTKFHRDHRLILGQLALLTGLGADFVFTNVFTTPLP